LPAEYQGTALIRRSFREGFRTLAGWSRGRNTAGWSHWSHWYSEPEVDPVSCSIQPFLDFLADLYEEGLQYRSVNLIRSAVSMILKQSH